MTGSRYSHHSDSGSLTRADGMPLDYMPEPHRSARVGEHHEGEIGGDWRSCFDVSGRIAGIAPGTEGTSDGTPTVLCRYADGTSEVRTVASFAHETERETTGSVEPTALHDARSDLERFAGIIGTVADYD